QLMVKSLIVHYGTDTFFRCICICIGQYSMLWALVCTYMSKFWCPDVQMSRYIHTTNYIVTRGRNVSKLREITHHPPRSLSVWFRLPTISTFRYRGLVI